VVALTGLLSVLALLADLWHGMEHVLLAPSSLSTVAVTLLAGVVLAGALAACLASGARLGRLSAAVQCHFAIDVSTGPMRPSPAVP
jgi:hypothetical protein